MRKINSAKTSTDLAEFVKKTVTGAGFTDVIVAVSGGVDSAVSISLAVKALGLNHVHAILLPYKDLHNEAKKHANLLLNQLEISESHIYEVNISSTTDSLLKEVGLPFSYSSSERISGPRHNQKWNLFNQFFPAPPTRKHG